LALQAQAKLATLGEDGPADPNETVAAWWQAINATDHPTVLVLTRQNLAVLSGSKTKAMTGVARGGYVLSPQRGRQPMGILIASGSEVALALQAQAKLATLGEDGPADPNETVAAWWQAINATDHPTVLVLTRQNLAVLSGSKTKAMTGVARGGYVLSPQRGRQPMGILIASGSEVALALQAQAKLA
ncbi:hypothetical protein WP50_38995, partial [Lactiplantibacillus plantarum]